MKRIITKLTISHIFENETLIYKKEDYQNSIIQHNYRMRFIKKILEKI